MDNIIECRSCRKHVEGVLHKAESNDEFDVIFYKCSCGKLSVIPNPYGKLYDENGIIENIQTGIVKANKIITGTCKDCGKEIEKVGSIWHHTTYSPRHMAIPQSFGRSVR